VKGTSVALVLLAGSLTGAQAATGEPGQKESYKVRYLIFQHQGYWDNPLDAEGPGKTDRRGNSQTLDSLWTRLSKSSRYRPLLQGLEVPFAKSREAAEAIAISDQWPASLRPPFAGMQGPADRLLRLTKGRAFGAYSVTTGPGTDRVFGSLTFYKGRYAHLEVNLAFVEDQRWMPWGLDRRYYFLQQSRRLLPNRFYYFDHPRFGVIARIEPME